MLIKSDPVKQAIFQIDNVSVAWRLWLFAHNNTVFYLKCQYLETPADQDSLFMKSPQMIVYLPTADVESTEENTLKKRTLQPSIYKCNGGT